MGKVRDEAPAKATKPASKSASGGWSFGWLGSFLGNLLRGDTYKPSQGWYARLLTVLGLGVVAVAGVIRFTQTQLDAERFGNPWIQYGLPVGLVALFGWFIFRLVQYPPFADFLIATESEMNKVSWTTKDELKRATMVVLGTVILMAMYLLVVDLVWQFLLKAIGVLQFQDASAFGSQVG